LGAKNNCLFYVNKSSQPGDKAFAAIDPGLLCRYH
jgi:hypothetical protein